MHNVPMRLVHFIAGLAIPLVFAGGALTPGLDSRSFTGTGPVGTYGAIEFYLPEGTYHHRLFGTPGCSITAGVVSARGSQDIPLSDLLQEANLSVGPQDRTGADASPALSFSVASASWVNLHVGSESTCRWAYSITGPFLADSGMLASHSQRTQWWLAITAALTTGGLTVAALRRKPSPSDKEDEPAIRVVDG
jgi:hypothetical protein